MAEELAADQMDSSALANSMMADLTATPQSPSGAPPAPEAPKPGEPKAEPVAQPELKVAAPPAKPPATPPKPAAQPAPKGAPKPGEAAPSDDDLDKVKDPVELRKRLKQIKEEYSGFKLTRQQEEEKLKKQITAYESRKYLTPEQEAEHDRIVKRQAELERELYGQNFRKSPEFKQQFQDKLDGLWSDAVEEVTGLPVKIVEKNQDGEEVEKSRPATPADLKAVLDASPAERFRIAEKLFGSARDLVLGHVRELTSVQKAAIKAVADKQAAYETEIQQRSAASQKEQQTYEEFLAKHSESLQSSRPDIYAPDETNPKVTEALTRGKAFVDDAFKNASTMDVNTRAARVAIIRSMASAFPRVLEEREQARTKIKELEAELAKFRASDPGSGTEGGAPPETGKSDEPSGSDALADSFKTA